MKWEAYKTKNGVWKKRRLWNADDILCVIFATAMGLFLVFEFVKILVF